MWRGMRSTGRFLFAFLLPVTHGFVTNSLGIEGDNFTMNGEYFDMWGVRVASAAVEVAYKDQLIEYLDEYYLYGINTLTVFYMGSSGGFEDPFLPNGTGFANTSVRDNMREIISECDSRGMAVIVGIFYQKQASGGGLENW
mmetsp:Transcript_38495/g.73973  ORF Transcript_38495/g.73973 Transcript_38495/m.73973 type:complete len:141 (-) Transcript_38495:1072-1494(-)